LTDPPKRTRVEFGAKAGGRPPDKPTLGESGADEIAPDHPPFVPSIHDPSHVGGRTLTLRLA
jgi:hypothetical protein